MTVMNLKGELRRNELRSHCSKIIKQRRPKSKHRIVSDEDGYSQYITYSKCKHLQDLGLVKVRIHPQLSNLNTPEHSC